MREYVLTPQFRKLLIEGKEDEARAATLIKAGAFEVRAVSDGEDAGTVDIIASTADRDRWGDRVSVKGWKLKNFRANPVILWSHEHGVPPVGRAKKVWAEDGKLIKRVEFTPEDLNPFGAMIGAMVKGRFLNAASVGFEALKWVPTKADKDEDSEELQARYPYALDFQQQELLESSIVTIPANPFALAQARAAGIDTKPMAELASQMLDAEAPIGPLLSKSWYERAYADARESCATVIDLGASAPTDTEPQADEAVAQEPVMTAREKVAAARKQLEDAKAAAIDLATDMQSAIVEACGELEVALRDCAELGVEIAEGTIERLKACAHVVGTKLPQPEPVEEPVVEAQPDKQLSADDLAEVADLMSDVVAKAVDVALGAHKGRLQD